MDKKDRIVLEKIKEYCESIEEYTKSISTAEELKTDKKTMSATVFEIMQIGELLPFEDGRCRSARKRPCYIPCRHPIQKISPLQNLLRTII